MNSNFIFFILVLLIIYLYYNPQRDLRKNVCQSSMCKKINKSNRINIKDFNPAIHHPAAL